MAQSWAMSKSRQIGLLIEAGQDIDPNEYQNNPERIDKLLSAGVTFKDKKKRVWVAKGQPCYEIYPRALRIADSDNTLYWQWLTGSDGIEMAKAVMIKQLQVEGSFWTQSLPLNVTYTVSFRLRIEKTAYENMEGESVNLKLTLPDGSKQELDAPLPKEKVSGDDTWDELKVGKIEMTPQNVGEMKFAMKREFENWSGGLVIKSVQIKTK